MVSRKTPHAFYYYFLGRKKAMRLTRVLDNLADELAILDISANLFWERDLLVIIFLGLRRKVDVDAGTLGGEDLGVETLLGEVDCSAINLVEQDGGEGSEDLKGEVGALDDIDGGNQCINDNASARTVVDADGVGLANQADSSVLAVCDENGLRNGDFDLNRGVGVFEIFDNPLVAVELLLGLFLGGGRRCNALSADAVGLRLEFRSSATAAIDAVLASLAVRYGRSSAQRGVLVCHLALVDLSQTRCDSLASV